ncbi:HNH endonuclease, partial [Escherichia coli]|nr:HNH endonuclease [Escherichia coli]
MKYLGEFMENQPCTWLDAARGSKKENVQQLELIAEELSENYSSYDNLIESSND